MGGAPQRLRRVHRAAVADQRRDRPGVLQRRADRRRHVAAEHAAAREEVAPRPRRHQLLHRAEGRRRIVGDQRVVGQGVEHGEHRRVGRQRPAVRRGEDLGARRRGVGRLELGARGDARRDGGRVDQFAQDRGGGGERRRDFADEREVGGVLAAERLRRLGDVEDLDPLGDRLDVAIGIGDEGAAADQHERLQAGQARAHLGEVRLQHAGPARMRGGEGDARGELRAPHRVAARFGECDQGVGRRGREVVAEHHDDVVGAVGGERLGQRRRVGRGAEPRRGGGAAASARSPPRRARPSAATGTPGRTAACGRWRRRAAASCRRRRRAALRPPISSPAKRARRDRRRATARSTGAACPAGRR